MTENERISALADLDRRMMQAERDFEEAKQRAEEIYKLKLSEINQHMSSIVRAIKEETKKSLAEIGKLEEKKMDNARQEHYSLARQARAREKEKMTVLEQEYLAAKITAEEAYRDARLDAQEAYRRVLDAIALEKKRISKA